MFVGASCEYVSYVFGECLLHLSSATIGIPPILRSSFVPSLPFPEPSRQLRCSLLAGVCCPNEAGIYLSCCGTVPARGTAASSSSTQDTNSDTSKSVEDDGACARHDGCADLEGDCCPTGGGGYLSCCSEERNSSSVSQGAVADGGGDSACAKHEGCTGLTGDCCPNPGGMYLACC